MRSPYSLTTRRDNWTVSIISALIGLTFLVIAYSVSADIRADKCAVPIEQLSWIGAGYCDRMAEWIDLATGN